MAVTDAKTLKTLRRLTASTIAREKWYNVPAVCRRYGLSDGTGEEAQRSKFVYVSNRLKELRSHKVLETAHAVQVDMPSHALGEALANIQKYGGRAVTKLTRRRIVTVLEGMPLEGNLHTLKFLSKIWLLDELHAPTRSREQGIQEHLARHYLINSDMETREVLETLGIYNCPQSQFFQFLEALTTHLPREAPDQYDFVARLNRHLTIDGFSLQEVGCLSSNPRFAVRTVSSGTTPANEAISQTLAAFNPTDIHGRWQEALTRHTHDLRGAITLAQTLLEDTCKWIINAAGETFEETDDLSTLYRRLMETLKLAPDDHHELISKQILGNYQSISESMGAIQNKWRDADSLGPKQARPQTRHAELVINLAGTMATFLFAMWKGGSSTDGHDDAGRCGVVINFRKANRKELEWYEPRKG